LAFARPFYLRRSAGAEPLSARRVALQVHRLPQGGTIRGQHSHQHPRNSGNCDAPIAASA
jgi:hypothetical protein